MSIVSSALGLVTGGVSSFAMPLAAGGVVLSLAAGGALWFHEHDQRVVAEVAAAEAVKVATAQHEQDQRTVAGLTAAFNTASARADALAQLKEAIHAAPKSTACITSPAGLAFAHAMRQRTSGSGGATPAVAGGSMAVPGRTGAP